MNSANETLRSIRNQKAVITKKYNEAVERCKSDTNTLKELDDRFVEDMKILDKEEKELMKQFNDIPIGDKKNGK